MPEKQVMPEELGILLQERILLQEIGKLNDIRGKLVLKAEKEDLLKMENQLKEISESLDKYLKKMELDLNKIIELNNALAKYIDNMQSFGEIIQLSRTISGFISSANFSNEGKALWLVVEAYFSQIKDSRYMNMQKNSKMYFFKEDIPDINDMLTELLKSKSDAKRYLNERDIPNFNESLGNMSKCAEYLSDKCAKTIQYTIENINSSLMTKTGSD